MLELKPVLNCITWVPLQCKRGWSAASGSGKPFVRQGIASVSYVPTLKISSGMIGLRFISPRFKTSLLPQNHRVSFATVPCISIIAVFFFSFMLYFFLTPMHKKFHYFFCATFSFFLYWRFSSLFIISH